MASNQSGHLNLKSKDFRKNLPKRKEPYWANLGRGMAGVQIGYSNYSKTPTWRVRVRINSKYQSSRIGNTDDFSRANGNSLLSLSQASEKAFEMAQSILHPKKADTSGTILFAEGLELYLKDYYSKRTDTKKKSIERTLTNVIGLHFADKPIGEISTAYIEEWMMQNVDRPRNCSFIHHSYNSDKYPREDDPRYEEYRRRRMVTANRYLTLLKAVLNFLYEKGHIESKAQWDRVKKYRNVENTVIRWLSRDEIKELVDVVTSWSFTRRDIAALVLAALRTGGRYSELTNLLVRDFNPRARTIHFFNKTKSKKPRQAPLDDNGVAFFTELTKGKGPTDRLLLMHTNTPWLEGGHLKQVRLLVAKLNFEQPFTFHDLRHTYASHLVMNGASLKEVAEILGHASTKVTEKHYAHLCPDYVSETVRNKMIAI